MIFYKVRIQNEVNVPSEIRSIFCKLFHSKLIRNKDNAPHVFCINYTNIYTIILCIKKIPTQRINQKEEAASAMHWLLTDAPDNLTGQVLHLDGGMANVLA